MKYLPLSQIKISDNRIRRFFPEEKNQELIDSIQRLGLLHAPVVDLDSDNAYVLVAGERRFRAISDIYALGGTFCYSGSAVPEGTVPVTFLGDLPPIARLEAELEENTRRLDVTWQERAQAISKLEALRRAQAAERGEPPPTAADLAEELTGKRTGTYQTSTNHALILAKHLDNPEVAKAKTADEAMKTLRRQEVARKNAEVAHLVGQTFTAAVHEAHSGDAQELLKEMAASQFDVILTDPPYGMGADEFGDSGGATAGAHGYEDSPEAFTELLAWLPGELTRVTKPNAHLYWFCDLDWFHTIWQRLGAHGWRVFRTPLIWHKPSAYRAPWPEYGPQRKYETLLFAIKGDKKVNFLAGDVLTFTPDDNLGHGAQKPVALFTELLKRSAGPGQLVLDPFAGTGTIFPAAHFLKCKAVGIELDPASYGICVKRIKALP